MSSPEQSSPIAASSSHPLPVTASSSESPYSTLISKQDLPTPRPRFLQPRHRSSSYNSLIIKRAQCSESRVLSLSNRPNQRPRPQSTAFPSSAGGGAGAGGGTMVLYRFELPHSLSSSLSASPEHGGQTAHHPVNVCGPLIPLSAKVGQVRSPELLPGSSSMLLLPPALPFVSHSQQSSSTETTATNSSSSPTRMSSSPRHSLGRTASDGVFSMNLDSKYPSAAFDLSALAADEYGAMDAAQGTRHSGYSFGGVIPYAYDPDLDDDDSEDDDYYGEKEDIEKRRDSKSSSPPRSHGRQSNKPAALSRTGSPVRGIINISTLVLFIILLLCLFILYPVLRTEDAERHPLRLGENAFINSTGQVVEGGTEVPVDKRSTRGRFANEMAKIKVRKDELGQRTPGYRNMDTRC